jgi:hypothetical protein
LIINELYCKGSEEKFFVEKESLFNFAANKKTANAGNIGSLIFFEKRKI